MLAGKPEERLSFDYQVKLAQFFGYQDQSHILAIEQFMKDYFKVIKRNRELNEMLLQWFNETIVYHQKQKLFVWMMNFNCQTDSLKYAITVYLNKIRNLY